MKKFCIAFLLALVWSTPAQSPPKSNLSITAAWDDGTPLAGEIEFVDETPNFAVGTIVQFDATGKAALPPTVLNRDMYLVQVHIPDGNGGMKTIYEFPLFLAVINPANLASGSASVVFRKADNSIKSANVSVAMNF